MTLEDIQQDVFNETKEIKKTIPELRYYQKNQNDGVRESAKQGHRRIINCCATGSGKSLMMAELVLSILSKRKKVVVVLPRRSLVKQLSASFTAWGINHGVVMSQHKRFSMPDCQIVSIDTYMARIASGRMEFLEADTLIIDELHMQFTPKKLELFSKYKFVIGFSATPVAPKGQSLGQFYTDIVDTISMSELMEQGYLTKLKYYADPSIDLSKLKTGKDGDYRESQLGDVMDRPKLVGDIFENWKRIAAGKPTVIFASSQAHARHLCEEFNSHGYSFEYMDCNTPDSDRQAILDRVKSGKTTGITNVGIIGTGIDIPNLEVVVLARPTRLVSVYLQCCGRATRLFEGKEYGIIIDHAGIIERLGFATDDFEWSLDGKETVEDRLQKKKEEKKEPKDIVCGECGTVFRARRTCPACGYEIISSGEPIPVHQADLKEVEIVSKPKPADKLDWYSQLLYYANSKGYNRGYADNAFKEKFGHWPKKKNGIEPALPGPEVIKYIQYLNIRRAKGRKAA
jgi:DNA repair protein RadD